MKREMKKMLHERIGEFIEIPSKESTFEFSCVGCGQCCHNRTNEQTIMVSPRDLFLALKHNNQDRDAFIEKNFHFYIGEQSGLLICALNTKTLSDGRNICVFLKKKDGMLRCSIHDHKPSVCRIFPLGRIMGSNLVSEEEQKLTYILQTDVSCNKNIKEKDTHTLAEWIPDLEESEKAFLEFSSFTVELAKIINMRAVYDSKKIPDAAKSLIYGGFDMTMYRDYDYEKDFEPQFKSNAAAFLDVAKLFVEDFKQFDKTIVPKQKGK